MLWSRLLLVAGMVMTGMLATVALSKEDAGVDPGLAESTDKPRLVQSLLGGLAYLEEAQGNLGLSMIKARHRLDKRHTSCFILAAKPCVGDLTKDGEWDSILVKSESTTLGLTVTPQVCAWVTRMPEASRLNEWISCSTR